MIQILDLEKHFGDLHILKGVNITIPQGETVAIIGPSGSGTSTLLCCVNFMETPTSGIVKIDGEVVSEANLGLIRQKVGMVFQHFYLFPHMTVLENLTYSPITVLKLSKIHAVERATELLKRVGLETKADVYPHALSGGQKQRVAIARTLAMEPEVILFDEPTSALDPEMVKEVLNVIQSLAHTGITILLVTHEMNFARRLADRILFLDHGEVLEDTAPETFFKQPKTERAKAFLEKVL